MTDKNIAYCSYYLSYRDCDGRMFGDITSMIEDIQAQGLHVYKIYLGPLSKEDVNSLVSEALVSILAYQISNAIKLFLSLTCIGYDSFISVYHQA